VFDNANRGFKARVFWYVTLLIVSLFIFFTASFIYQQKKSLEEQFIKRGLSIVKNLANNSELGVFTENVDFLRPSINGARSEDNLAYAVVYNVQERALAHTFKDGETRFSLDMADGGIKAFMSQQSGKPVWRETSFEGNIIYEFWAKTTSSTPISGDLMALDTGVPQEVTNEVIGYARVGLSLEGIRSVISKSIAINVAILFAFLLLGAVITFLLAKMITEPIESLVVATEALAGGDLDHKIEFGRDDEIGKLAASFNKMTMAVKDREKALEASHKRLETVNKIGAMANSSLNLDLVLENILDGVMEEVGASVGMIFLRDLRTGKLGWGASKGLSQAFVDGYKRRAIEPGEGLTAHIAESGEPVYIREKSSQDSRIVRSVIKDENLNSFIGIPIFAGDEVVAVMNILTRPPDILDERSMTVIKSVASYLGSAILNARLFAESQRLAKAIEQSMEEVIIADTDGSIQYVNPAFERITGFKLSEAVGRKLSQILQIDGSSDLYQHILDTISRGSVWSGRIVSRARDGDEYVTYGVISPLFDSDGNIINYVSVMRDITNEEKMERQVQQVQKLESLGVLAGGIAHDFNNLLVGILGNAELALGDLPEDSEASKSILDLIRISRRAADLVQQMLAYSGKGKFIVEAIDLACVVKDMVELLEVAIAKNVTLKLNITEDVPTIEVDVTQIRQVLMNLVINASESIGQNNGTVTVTTSQVEVTDRYVSRVFWDEEIPDGIYVCLDVSDTGEGMDEETKAKIFDPFFTTKFTGRGLGLAAVMGIVRGHNGAMSVYSEKGVGTTFKILLPASAQRAVSAPAKDYNDDGYKLVDDLCVLVVDDEETVRSVTKRSLTKLGCSVVLACDGQEGVDIFTAQHDSIDLVVLDMTMPRLNGLEALKEMRKVQADIPVILFSGYSEQEATSVFTDMGISGFIQKPFTKKELFRMVKEVVDKDIRRV